MAVLFEAQTPLLTEKEKHPLNWHECHYTQQEVKRLMPYGVSFEVGIEVKERNKGEVEDHKQIFFIL